MKRADVTVATASIHLPIYLPIYHVFDVFCVQLSKSVALLAIFVGGSGFPVVGEADVLSPFADERISKMVNPEPVGTALRLASQENALEDVRQLSKEAVRVWKKLTIESRPHNLRTLIQELSAPSSSSPSLLKPQSPVIAIVVGVRPNLMKAAPIIAAFQKLRPSWRIELVHTGQHTDKMMSDVFFDELGIKKPDR